MKNCIKISDIKAGHTYLVEHKWRSLKPFSFNVISFDINLIGESIVIGSVSSDDKESIRTINHTSKTPCFHNNGDVVCFALSHVIFLDEILFEI